MTIYEALNWIKEANYTPCGYIIFNENKPEGQLKGKALKTIFEAAKNDELVPVEVFNQVKKERDNAAERLEEKQLLYSGDGYSEGRIVYDMALCPSCGYEYEDGDITWGEPYCPHCGQKLKWREQNNDP